MATSFRHGTKPHVFGLSIVPPRVTYLDMPSIGASATAPSHGVGSYAGYLERHETPGNAKGNAGTVTASPGSGQVNGSRTSNAPATLHNGAVTVTSRSVTQGQGCVPALPWSGLVTEDSLKAHDQGGPRARLTGFISKTGRSPTFPHPQLAGRPCRLTSGGGISGGNDPPDQDRPLNCLFINVQKKGDSGAQKTQTKPMHNPLGFHGSSHG